MHSLVWMPFIVALTDATIDFKRTFGTYTIILNQRAWP